MVKINSQIPNQNQTNSIPNSQTQPNSQNQKPQSNLISTIGQLLPLAPFMWEQFTGQKVPQMSGTMAEINLTLSQIQVSLQALIQNQQQLTQRLVNLENNAQSQFTNLVSQVQSIKSIRLTHDRERKRIEFNNSREDTEDNPNTLNDYE